MKARAKGMAVGIEPEPTVAVDVFFPIEALAGAARDFRLHFPATPLRLYVEALGAAVEPVIDGRVVFGLAGSLPVLPAGLAIERLSTVRFIMVATASHPVRGVAGHHPERRTGSARAILTDRSVLAAEREFGVMAPSTWRLADLFAKRALLLNGLGWGGMPRHAVEPDGLQLRYNFYHRFT
jgi:DNA-binding transcriptional LysR family regulator